MAQIDPNATAAANDHQQQPAISGNQIMFNSESNNYSNLMRHLYQNDEQSMPHIECGTDDMFLGGKSDHRQDTSAINSAGNNRGHFQDPLVNGLCLNSFTIHVQ